MTEGSIVGEARRRAAAKQSYTLADATRSEIRLSRVGPGGLTLGEALTLCPYRTLVGFALVASSLEDRAPEIALVVLEGDPSDELSAETEADVLAVLKRGGTVLIAATDQAVRDALKAKVMALCPIRTGGLA